MLSIFVLFVYICGSNAQPGFPNQQFGQQQFGQQFPNQQFGQQFGQQFPNQQFGQQGILGQPGLQNQFPGQVIPGQITGQVLPGQIPGQIIPGQVGFGNNFAQNQQFLQQNVGNPNSCHVRGCGIGQQCVYRSNIGVSYICPSWIPVLPCQCLPGCKAQNQFIQVGQTKQIDTCGNRCTCNTQSGQASCTQIACNQASPGAQPQTLGTVPGGVPGAAIGGIPGALNGGVRGVLPGGLPGGIQGGVPGGIPGVLPGGVQRPGAPVLGKKK